MAVGTYSVTILNSDNCSTVESYKIEEAAPVINVNSTVGHTCPEYNYGSISLSVSGDDPPFSYSWSNGGSGSNINNLETGDYSVTVYDNRGCSTVREYEIDDTNVLIMEDQSYRDNCIVEFFCNGVSVPEEVINIGENSGYDPDDCLYYEYRCEDGGYFFPGGPGSERVMTGYTVDYDYENCTAQIICENGDEYDYAEGDIITRNFHGGDPTNEECIYCFTATYCKLTIFEEEVEVLLDVESHLENSVLTVDQMVLPCIDGNSESCTLNFYCSHSPNDPQPFVTFCSEDCDAESLVCSEEEQREIAEDYRKDIDTHSDPFFNEENNAKDISVNVYPNPFQSYFYLEINTEIDRAFRIDIKDVNGRMLKFENHHILKGENIIRINNLENFSSGLFIVSLFDQENQTYLSLPVARMR